MAPEPASVWVVDDDHAVRFVLLEALREAGYRVQGFDGARAALAALDDEDTAPDLVFTDVRMPGLDGLGFLDALKARRPQLPVVVMSAYTDIASTAGAFRGGAHDFLSKPFDLDDAVALAARALPEATPLPTPRSEDAQRAQGELLGRTPAMRELFRAIGRLAQAPIGVLITGETGTGKELVARALHRESPRARGPFVALNTAAIPAELLESELFGHEAGAFTGAGKRHVGRFEQAHGGSLFLDEIGDMPAGLQTRLLRVLAEGEFFRVGGRELIRVDVRVLAATHQDLDRLVAEGRFRADLLHRLDVVRLVLPPLRERKADIACWRRVSSTRRRASSARRPSNCRPTPCAGSSSTTGPATFASCRTCAGAWSRWRPARRSRCATCARCSSRARRRGRARRTGPWRWRRRWPWRWSAANRTCTRSCASASTRSCSTPPCATPAATASRPRRCSASAAIPSPASSARRDRVGRPDRRARLTTHAGGTPWTCRYAPPPPMTST